MNEHNILWFKIPMDNMILMHIVDSQQSLPHQEGSRLFSKFVAIPHILIKLAIGSQFHEQINFILVTKERIKFD